MAPGVCTDRGRRRSRRARTASRSRSAAASVDSVREEWLVEDRWWTARPLRRRYFELTLANGANTVVFCDLASGRWYSPERA